MPATTLGRSLATVPTGLLIAGRWVDATTGRTFAVTDPATAQEVAQVADASLGDADAAVTAASEAQPTWSATPTARRVDVLRRAHDVIMAREEEFASVICAEMGKPVAEARAEVRYGAGFLRWYADQATQPHGNWFSDPDGGNRLALTQRPVGPALLITPWNFPLAMATRKIAPALAAGCTTILKPSELTPLTALLLADVLRSSGLPDGALNVIPTTSSVEVVRAILRDPRVRKLSFTGSTAVGRALMAESTHQLLRTSMELGGNAPFLVFADADLDAAIDGAVAAKLRNGGQACTAANRFLVQAAVHDEFVDRLAARFAALRVGAGADRHTDLGPLITTTARDRVHQLVLDSVADGARLVTGGEPVPGAGAFYPATIIDNVAPATAILNVEIFGPVAPITVFDTEEDAVDLANATEYGLAAYGYTGDMDRGLRLAERVESGMFGLNTGLISTPAAPFGGIKHSGHGREGGPRGIEEYLETHYLAVPSPFRAIENT